MHYRELLRQIAKNLELFGLQRNKGITHGFVLFVNVKVINVFLTVCGKYNTIGCFFFFFNFTSK
jgi:hypothetical protein